MGKEGDMGREGIMRTVGTQGRRLTLAALEIEGIENSYKAGIQVIYSFVTVGDLR